MMNTVIRDQWAADLESGEYEQGFGYLAVSESRHIPGQHRSCRHRRPYGCVAGQYHFDRAFCHITCRLFSTAAGRSRLSR
jgi:hypothetical protein